MFQKLPKYQNYRETHAGSAELCGSVPAHWARRRLGTLLREVDQRSETGKEQLLRVSQYTGVTERRTASGDDIDSRSASLVGYKKVSPGQLAVNIMLAWNGSLGISQYSGLVSPAYCVYRFKSTDDPWYFHYLLRSSQMKYKIRINSRGIIDSRLRLYSQDLYKLDAAVPPAEEQAAIVKYLAHATARIDKAIATKRRLLFLLDEQNRSKIWVAVSGQQDDDVLRRSGLYWLPYLPSSWEVRKLRSLFARQGSGTTPSGDHYYGGSHPWVMSGDLNDRVVSQTKRAITDAALDEVSPLRIHPAGSLAIAMYGASIGKTGIFAMPSTTNQACTVFSQPRPGVNTRWVQTVMRLARPALQQLGAGGGQPNVNAEIVAQFRIPVPRPSRQDEILAGLDYENQIVDARRERAHREVELLREFRTRLISDVVTGQVDVRAIAASLPDVDPTVAWGTTEAGDESEDPELDDALVAADDDLDV